MRSVMLKGRGTRVEHFTGLWMEQASGENCQEEKPECISTCKGKFHRERPYAFAQFCCREVFLGNWEAAGRPIGWCSGRALELPTRSTNIVYLSLTELTVGAYGNMPKCIDGSTEIEAGLKSSLQKGEWFYLFELYSVWLIIDFVCSHGIK